MCSVNGNIRDPIEYLKFYEEIPVLWFLQSNINNLKTILPAWKVLSEDSCSHPSQSKAFGENQFRCQHLHSR